jgi:RecG-like helicase
MNNAASVEHVTPNTIFQLEKELNVFEARQTRTAQIVKKTFDVLATVGFVSTGVTAIFAATWIPALALAGITVAIIAIANQFFTGKKFSVSREILNDLLSSKDPAVQKLFFRYSKACAEETFNHLYSIDPGIEQSKLRKIFLQNVKNKELKELLEKELDSGEFCCTFAHLFTPTSNIEKMR